MQGLGVGRGRQRHKAVLSLADNERNTFVFTAFGSYQQAERIPWRKPNVSKPSQGGSYRTRRCMCRQGAVQPLSRPMRADWWKAHGRPLAAEGRTAQDAGGGRAAVLELRPPTICANA